MKYYFTLHQTTVSLCGDGCLQRTSLSKSAQLYRAGTERRCKISMESCCRRSHYILCRTVDGASYEKIAALDGFPSETTQNYSTLDQRPKAGINYYRIKYMKEQNQQAYSQVIAIRLPNSTYNTSIQLSPNPASNRLMLHTTTEARSVRVYDLMGKIMFEQAFKEELDVSLLPAGLYVVQLLSANGAPLASQKFLKK